MRSAAAAPSRLRARAARQPREHPACAGRDARALPRRPRRGPRTAELAERLEFDLTQELGYRYPDFSDGADPAIRQLARVCEDAFSERYPPSNRLLLGEARARLETELKLIDELGLAGFFLLHWEVLELARELAVGIRGPGSPRRFLPPGRGRGSSVGSIVCYLTGLSHVDPVAQNLSLGPLPEPRADVGPRHRPRLPARHPRAADRRRHRALRPRARGARRQLLHLPLARRDPRRRQGARPAVRRARAARARLRRLEREAGRRRAGAAPGRRAEAGLAALARLRRADPRDRRPAAPHLAASRRDGDLHAAARRARAGAARGDGRKAALPVGQGLLLRRRLPEDRPARAGDALGGRGLRRADRRGLRRADRPLPDPARRPRRSSRRSSGRTRSATSRSRAARRCRACCARSRRTSTI